MNFITFLHLNNSSYNTIVTYTSALSFVCKLYNIENIPNLFIVRKLLTAIQRTSYRPYTRLPITHSILKQLIQNIMDNRKLTHYVRSLLIAMYTLAFSAFLRIGEIVSTDPLKCLQYEDCSLNIDSVTKSKQLMIKLSQFKGNISGIPFMITIPASHDTFCTVAFMEQYLKLRGSLPGPLFLFNGKGVNRNFFALNLRFHLRISGYDPQFYKGHSFRIGAATTAASLGMTDQEIQKLGRWNSNAFKRYIRIPNLITKL